MFFMSTFINSVNVGNFDQKWKRNNFFETDEIVKDKDFVFYNKKKIVFSVLDLKQKLSCEVCVLGRYSLHMDDK